MLKILYMNIKIAEDVKKVNYKEIVQKYKIQKSEYKEKRLEESKGKSS